MKAHFLQHVAFEGLGSIESWLKRSGYRISRTPFFESQTLQQINFSHTTPILKSVESIMDISTWTLPPMRIRA